MAGTLLDGNGWLWATTVHICQWLRTAMVESRNGWWWSGNCMTAMVGNGWRCWWVITVSWQGLRMVVVENLALTESEAGWDWHWLRMVDVGTGWEWLMVELALASNCMTAVAASAPLQWLSPWSRPGLSTHSCCRSNTFLPCNMQTFHNALLLLKTFSNVSILQYLGLQHAPDMFLRLHKNPLSSTFLLFTLGGRQRIGRFFDGSQKLFFDTEF